MTTIQELREGVAYVSALLVDMHERAGSDPLDEAAEADFDAGTAYITETRATIERLEAREAQVNELRSLAQVPNAVVPGDTRDAGFNVTRTATSDPFDTRSLVEREMNGDYRVVDEYNARARTVVEQARISSGDEGREQATSLIDGPDNARGQVSKHILRYGSPEYRQAFEDYVRNPYVVPQLLMEGRAAMNEGTNANGGYVVPFVLDPTLILNNAGTVGPWREISASRTTTTNTWHGITSAGVTAEWIGEATEVADASPTVSQPTITVYKADAYIQASMELIMDSTISGEIAGLLADSKGRLENAAFATGNGVTQPRGVITATSGAGQSVAGASGAAGAADLVAADIFALDNAMSPRWRPNAHFVANKVVLNKIRQINNGNTPYQSTFWVDFGGGIPSKLIGYPIHESSDMDGTIVSGSNDDCLVLGDFSQYVIVDRLGMEVMFNPLVLGSNRRPTGESAWVAFWRTGADCLNSTAFKTLRL